MKETIDTIIQWHKETFPDATLEGQRKKWQEEYGEWNNTETGTQEELCETADMIIVAVRADCDKYGTKLAAQKFANDKWGSHKKYNDWCEEHRKPALNARAFWRSVAALAELPEHHIAVLSSGKYDTADGGHARVFRIDPVGMTKEEKEIDNLEDLPL